MQESQERAEYTVVARKPSFGLPTGCPICLPLFIYLKFSNFPFHLVFNNTFPDSDQIPYIEAGTYVACNDENGGVTKSLKEDGFVDLDTDFSSLPEWISMKAMVSTWLADAIMYELWVGSDGTSARTIYYSGLPWLIGKALLMKQVHVVKQRLGITKENAERREAEVYKREKIAFGALSTTLGDHAFLFERPSSLDAYFLGHVLFTLQAFPESSMLQSALLEHGNLIRYAEKLKTDFMEAGSSSSVVQFLSDASSTSTRRSKPKKQPKRERTEEEKTFRRRARYFLVTQVVAVLVFQSVMSSNDFSEVEVDEDEDEGFSYD
ncbi:mitochondrial outer membrane import complex protein METAXIN [Populus alba x Populus x berolinensis]|nr:mitochondrial outer membrane import complex protein METAXIN [Populus alba x Populus x berolinensis]